MGKERVLFGAYECADALEDARSPSLALAGRAAIKKVTAAAHRYLIPASLECLRVSGIDMALEADSGLAGDVDCLIERFAGAGVGVLGHPL